MYATRDSASCYELSARDRNGTVVIRLQNNWTTTLSLASAQLWLQILRELRVGRTNVGAAAAKTVGRQSDEMMGDHLYGRRHSLHTKHETETRTLKIYKSGLGNCYSNKLLCI